MVLVWLELLPFRVIVNRTWLQFIYSKEALFLRRHCKEVVGVRRGISKTKQKQALPECSQPLKNKK